MSEIQEYDLVVVDQDILASDKETKQPILLRKGQVGTILMDFDGEAYLIDFADKEGKTYAMETISKEKLIPLLYQPVTIQAS